MCDQTEIEYKAGEVVWCKLSNLWWPAQVQNQDDLDEEVTQGLKKRPLAVVKFFNEDFYDFIKDIKHICHYNSSRKLEFIRKGMDTYRSMGETNQMSKFPKDIIMAEEITGGNVNILDDPRLAPEEKVNYNEVFNTPKPPKDIKVLKRNKNFSFQEKSLLKQTPAFGKPEPEKKYFTKYLVQKCIIPDSNIYNCPECNFVCSRLVLLSYHRSYNKLHGCPKTPSRFMKPNTSLHKIEKTIMKRKSTGNESSPMKKKSKLAQSKGPSEEPPKKIIKVKTVVKQELKEKDKKKSEAMREQLLLDWNEEEGEESDDAAQDFQDTFESKLEDKPLSQGISNATSCFDFEDNDEDMNMDRSMRFGQKLPRVIPKEDKSKEGKSKENNSSQDDVLEEEFNNLMKETVVPNVTDPFLSDSSALPGGSGKAETILGSKAQNQEEMLKSAGGNLIEGQVPGEVHLFKKTDDDNSLLLRALESDSPAEFDQRELGKSLKRSNNSLCEEIVKKLKSDADLLASLRSDSDSNSSPMDSHNLVEGESNIPVLVEPSENLEMSSESIQMKRSESTLEKDDKLNISKPQLSRRRSCSSINYKKNLPSVKEKKCLETLSTVNSVETQSKDQYMVIKKSIKTPKSKIMSKTDKAHLNTLCTLRSSSPKNKSLKKTITTPAKIGIERMGNKEKPMISESTPKSIIRSTSSQPENSDEMSNSLIEESVEKKIAMLLSDSSSSESLINSSLASMKLNPVGGPKKVASIERGKKDKFGSSKSGKDKLRSVNKLDKTFLSGTKKSVNKLKMEAKRVLALEKNTKIHNACDTFVNKSMQDTNRDKYKKTAISNSKSCNYDSEDNRIDGNASSKLSQSQRKNTVSSKKRSSDSSSPTRKLNRSPIKSTPQSVLKSPTSSPNKNPVQSSMKSPNQSPLKSPIRSIKSPPSSSLKTPTLSLKSASSSLKNLSPSTMKSPPRSTMKSPPCSTMKSPPCSTRKSPPRSSRKSPPRSSIKSLTKTTIKSLNKSTSKNTSRFSLKSSAPSSALKSLSMSSDKRSLKTFDRSKPNINLEGQKSKEQVCLSTQFSKDKKPVTSRSSKLCENSGSVAKKKRIYDDPCSELFKPDVIISSKGSPKVPGDSSSKVVSSLKTAANDTKHSKDKFLITSSQKRDKVQSVIKVSAESKVVGGDSIAKSSDSVGGISNVSTDNQLSVLKNKPHEQSYKKSLTSDTKNDSNTEKQEKIFHEKGDKKEVDPVSNELSSGDTFLSKTENLQFSNSACKKIIKPLECKNVSNELKIDSSDKTKFEINSAITTVSTSSINEFKVAEVSVKLDSLVSKKDVYIKQNSGTEDTCQLNLDSSLNTEISLPTEDKVGDDRINVKLEPSKFTNKCLVDTPQSKSDKISFNMTKPDVSTNMESKSFYQKATDLSENEPSITVPESTSSATEVKPSNFEGTSVEEIKGDKSIESTNIQEVLENIESQSKVENFMLSSPEKVKLTNNTSDVIQDSPIESLDKKSDLVTRAINSLSGSVKSTFPQSVETDRSVNKIVEEVVLSSNDPLDSKEMIKSSTGVLSDGSYIDVLSKEIVVEETESQVSDVLSKETVKESLVFDVLPKEMESQVSNVLNEEVVAKEIEFQVSDTCTEEIVKKMESQVSDSLTEEIVVKELQSQIPVIDPVNTLDVKSVEEIQIVKIIPDDNKVIEKLDSSSNIFDTDRAELESVIENEFTISNDKKSIHVNVSSSELSDNTYVSDTNSLSKKIDKELEIAQLNRKEAEVGDCMEVLSAQQTFKATTSTHDEVPTFTESMEDRAQHSVADTPEIAQDDIFKQSYEETPIKPVLGLSKINTPVSETPKLLEDIPFLLKTKPHFSIKLLKKENISHNENVGSDCSTSEMVIPQDTISNPLSGINSKNNKKELPVTECNDSLDKQGVFSEVVLSSESDDKFDSNVESNLSTLKSSGSSRMLLNEPKFEGNVDKMDITDESLASEIIIDSESDDKAFNLNDQTPSSEVVITDDTIDKTAVDVYDFDEPIVDTRLPSSTNSPSIKSQLKNNPFGSFKIGIIKPVSIVIPKDFPNQAVSADFLTPDKIKEIFMQQPVATTTAKTSAAIRPIVVPPQSLLDEELNPQRLNPESSALTPGLTPQEVGMDFDINSMPIVIDDSLEDVSSPGPSTSSLTPTSSDNLQSVRMSILPPEKRPSNTPYNFCIKLVEPGICKLKPQSGCMVMRIPSTRPNVALSQKTSNKSIKFISQGHLTRSEEYKEFSIATSHGKKKVMLQNIDEFPTKTLFKPVSVKAIASTGTRRIVPHRNITVASHQSTINVLTQGRIVPSIKTKKPIDCRIVTSSQSENLRIRETDSTKSNPNILVKRTSLLKRGINKTITIKKKDSSSSSSLPKQIALLKMAKQNNPASSATPEPSTSGVKMQKCTKKGAPKEDILAKALADTQVFQETEEPSINTSLYRTVSSNVASVATSSSAVTSTDLTTNVLSYNIASTPFVQSSIIQRSMPLLSDEASLSQGLSLTNNQSGINIFHLDCSQYVLAVAPISNTNTDSLSNVSQTSNASSTSSTCDQSQVKVERPFNSQLPVDINLADIELPPGQPPEGPSDIYNDITTIPLPPEPYDSTLSPSRFLTNPSDNNCNSPELFQSVSNTHIS